jgi:hypothetical protein
MSLVWSYFDRCVYIDRTQPMVEENIALYMEYVNEYNDFINELNKDQTKLEQIALGTKKED